MVSKPISKQQNQIQAIVLVSVWLLANIWTYQWFIESLFASSYLNIILLSIGCIALAARLISTDFSKLELFEFRFAKVPFLLLIGGEIGAIALKWCLNIPQLTLLSFLLGSYGLLGLFISLTSWRKGLTIATIIACVVPFSVAFNSGLGFPVRVVTAHAVAQALSDFHLSAVSSHDIIVMENGVAQVDLPCSGMKSLWTGTVFLLGATFLEKRQLGWRWLLVAIANLLLLITANVIRVLILVVTIEVFQQPQSADILHLPLGIAGFALASAMTWILLQKVPRNAQLPSLKLKAALENKSNRQNRQQNFSWLIAGVICLGIVGQFNPWQSEQTVLNPLKFPETIATQTLDLTPAEANFFDNPTNPVVQKVRFNSAELTGSMLMVASNSWQSHHPPELCFLGNGFKVDKMESKRIADGINARWLSLQNGELSASYWFQSQQTTTDDFVARLWEHISHRDKTWVLVSILFDRPEDSESSEVKNFSKTIYRAIERNYFHS